MTCYKLNYIEKCYNCFLKHDFDIVSIMKIYESRGRGSALPILTTRFWPMGWGDGLDSGHVPTTWGWFWVHARNTGHLRPWSKEWVRCQKWMKNGRVMPIESWGESGVLAYFWLKIGYFGHIFLKNFHKKFSGQILKFPGGISEFGH